MHTRAYVLLYTKSLYLNSTEALSVVMKLPLLEELDTNGLADDEEDEDSATDSGGGRINPATAIAITRYPPGRAWQESI